MKRKPNLLEKIGAFVTGKGFYLVVLVCVAAIALSGLYLYRSVRGALEDPDDQPVSGSASLSPASPRPTVTASPKVTARPNPTPSPSPKPTVTPTPTPAVTAKPSPSPSPSPSPAALVFTWPVNGTVISPHCVDALAYDPTMGDWRTHAGIDVSAAIGTEVKAAAAGSVAAIYEDDLYGTTVVIDHGKDLTSVYSNLAAVPTVKVGAKVSTGTVIGTVGSTAPSESRLDSHLHFAMYRSDIAVDPEKYLPER